MERTSIASALDFQSLLADTLDRVEALDRTAPPEYHVFDNIAAKLRALQTWSAEGKAPLSNAQKAKIDIGLIAIREFEDNPDPKIQEISRALMGLSAYMRTHL